MLADVDADAAAARDAARREEDVSLLLLRWAGAHMCGRGRAAGVRALRRRRG